jgi:uncharacterized protein (UPF0305 family)
MATFCLHGFASFINRKKRFMPAQKKDKLTKAVLLKAMDEKLSDLNLLRSALQADQSRKQEDLEHYQKQFMELMQLKKRK